MKFFEKYADYSLFVLRLGFALTLLWSVRTKFTSAEQVAGLFGNVGLPASPELVTVMGVLLLLAAIFLIIGWQVRLVSAFLTVFFIVTLVTAFNAGPAVWKDFGLLGASLALLFSGAGPKLCLDKSHRR